MQNASGNTDWAPKAEQRNQGSLPVVENKPATGNKSASREAGWSPTAWRSGQSEESK